MSAAKIGILDDFPVGSIRRVQVGDAAICVVRAQDGTMYAIQDECTHESYSLSEGELDGLELECPQHFSRFDLRTGRPTSLPADQPARVYPVRVLGNEVLLEMS